MVCAPRGPPRTPEDPRGDPRGPPRTPEDPRGDPRGPPRTPEGTPADHRGPPWIPEGTPADPRGPPRLPVEMVCEMVCDPRGPPRIPEASRQDGLRGASEEGLQENAGLRHGQEAGVQADVRERGRLRSHPEEQKEVVQEGGLCPGSRVRLRLLGLHGGRRSRRPNPEWSRAAQEEEEVLHLPAERAAVGGARAPPRAEARLAPRAPAGRCAPRAALADLSRVD